MSRLQQDTHRLSLIWGTLRNLIDFDSIDILQPFSLVGTVQGKFPVDTFHPIFLEIPRDNQKMDISGRSNNVFVSRSNQADWQMRRIVPLPEYREEDNYNIESLRSILQIWNQAFIPNEIPCISIATTIKGGHSSEGRIGQYSIVFLIWPNFTSRILELDWFEGPLDDCITPEWYIRTSELMTLNNAKKIMKKLHTKPPSWDKSVFSLYTIPSCLSINLNGQKDHGDIEGWRCNWTYNDYSEFKSDLELTLDELEELIY